MSHQTNDQHMAQTAYIFSYTHWFCFGLLVLCIAGLFVDSLAFMLSRWLDKEEYSHGFLMPFLCIFLIWQRQNTLNVKQFRASWLGVVLVVFGLFGFVVGELSSLYPIVNYAFLLVLAGLMLSCVGWSLFRYFWVPLLMLVLMVPLPNFLYRDISASLQLLSSALGVEFVRTMGMSVFLEGNIIDLGGLQLQVAEACSGLRYLFPLMTLSIIIAYFMQAPLWFRLIVMVSSAPITLVMNSLRIALIALGLEYWGIDMTEGILHDAEGWLVFIGCCIFLLIEIQLFNVFFAKRWGKASIVFNYPECITHEKYAYRSLPLTFYIAVCCVVSSVLVYILMPERSEVRPERLALVNFPMEIDEWRGRQDAMDSEIIQALKMDDYLLADYVYPQRVVMDDYRNTPFPLEPLHVNVYVAYYQSQRKGASVHSPRSCIPGGGWDIYDFQRLTVEGFEVNRALIASGEKKRLVYYWFQQRGRKLSNEYLVKWFLFWDSLTRQRSDGAMVRLTIDISDPIYAEHLALAEQPLQQFTQHIETLLPAYVPN